jgi:hypothetical protein
VETVASAVAAAAISDGVARRGVPEREPTRN